MGAPAVDQEEVRIIGAKDGVYEDVKLCLESKRGGRYRAHLVKKGRRCWAHYSPTLHQMCCVRLTKKWPVTSSQYAYPACRPHGKLYCSAWRCNATPMWPPWDAMQPVRIWLPIAAMGTRRKVCETDTLRGVTSLSARQNGPRGTVNKLSVFSRSVDGHTPFLLRRADRGWSLCGRFDGSEEGRLTQRALLLQWSGAGLHAGRGLRNGTELIQ